MRKLFLLTAILFIGMNAFSQKTVSGLVKDNEGKIVAYATLKFYTATDTAHPQAEKIADDAGIYFVQVKDTGSYFVKISAAGIKDSIIGFRIAQPVTKLDFTLTKSENNLNDVVVSAQSNPPMIQRKIDRVVMNVENNPLAAGKSSLDVFKLAPGVFVNNGEISINGVSGTRVMINGKLLHLSDNDLKNYLQNLRSSDIKSIEIIAHPPAEYDAEGSGGLINIVLKKNAQEGLNGYVGADYSIGLGKYPAYNPYVGLNFKRDKLQLNASYSYGWEKYFQNITQDRDLSDNGLYHSKSSSVHNNTGNTVNLGATYDITDKQYVALSYNGQFGNNRETSNSTTDIVYPNNATNNTNSTGSFPSNSRIKYSDYGLNYHLATDTLGSTFTFISDYTRSNDKDSSGTFSQTYNHENALTSDTSFYFNYPSITNIFTADAQYNKIFKSGTQLNVGGKATVTNINTDNSYDIFNGSTWNDDLSQGFNYLYKEKIFAGFANLSGKLLSIEYKIGLRGENSNVSGSLTGTSQDTAIKRNYFNLFPDVYFKRNTDKSGNNYITLSYNRRLSRPSYSELNPYKYYIDNYSVESGNPYLNPQFTNSVELGYTLHNQYYFSLSYSRTNDIINQVIETNPDNADMTVMRQNAGNSTVYTATFNVPVKITKWWTTSNNLLLTYIKNIAPAYDIKKASFMLQTQQEIDFTHTFSFTLNGFYTPNIAQGNFVLGHVADLDAGFQKKFLHNKLTARATVSDIFYTDNYKITSYYNQTKLSLTQKEQSRLLTLSLVYNFSLGKTFEAKQIKKSNSDEKSRL